MDLEAFEEIVRPYGVLATACYRDISACGAHLWNNKSESIGLSVVSVGTSVNLQVALLKGEEGVFYHCGLTEFSGDDLSQIKGHLAAGEFSASKDRIAIGGGNEPYILYRQ